MKDEFSPPISSRSTEELQKIVSSPQDWHPQAYSIANQELERRQISRDKLDNANLLIEKEKMALLEKAKLRYVLKDFLSSPYTFLIEILFSSELSKEGYIEKAKQQQVFRIYLGIILFCIFFSFMAFYYL
ncbi:MAG: hypothetical protein ACPGSD_07605 [Flavobacteriales bacterium]